MSQELRHCEKCTIQTNAIIDLDDREICLSCFESEMSALKWWMTGKKEMLTGASLGQLQDIASQIEEHPQEMTQMLIDFCKRFKAVKEFSK